MESTTHILFIKTLFTILQTIHITFHLDTNYSMLKKEVYMHTKMMYYIPSLLEVCQGKESAHILWEG